MKKVFCPHCMREMKVYDMRLCKCNHCGFSTIFCPCGAKMEEKKYNGHPVGNFICRKCKKTAMTDHTNQIFFSN